MSEQRLSSSRHITCHFREQSFKTTDCTSTE